ncbi:DUF2637 domain-containing protein [Micromonospora kangleipakensis]
MLTIGGAAGAASFTHVHNVAASHGQDGWLAWADAIVLELMSIAAGLELRYRKRQHASTRFPATVLMCAVTLSIAAQVVEAEQSVIGWIAAALPALGFLVMTKIALNRAAMPRPHRGALVPTGSGDGPVVAGRGARPRRSTEDRPRRHGDDHGRAGGVAVSKDGDRNSSAASLSPRRTAPPDATMDDLLPVARAARKALECEGLPLTRDTLADQLRRDGHAVRNARISALLALLRQDQVTAAPSAAQRPSAPAPRPAGLSPADPAP